jgi:hypothetical protein
MIQQELLDVVFEFNKSLQDISKQMPNLNSNIKTDDKIEEVFQRKKKLLKKVLIALKDDLTKEIQRANSENTTTESFTVPKESTRSRAKLTAPVHLSPDA